MRQELTLVRLQLSGIRCKVFAAPIAPAMAQSLDAVGELGYTWGIS